MLNTVKQGGVFSPVLFCIYLNGLLCRLAESTIGCFIGNVFMGALAYADDIASLASTTQAMRLMLGICDDFAQGFAIVFNAKMSKCLWVKHSSANKVASDRKTQFVIGGSVIEYSWPHLGHIIASSNDDNLDILNRRNSLCGQINDVLGCFDGPGPVTKLRLLKAYCSSYYGCELWDLSCKAVNDFCIMWRKRLKRVCGLTRDTHRFLLAPLCGTIPIMDEVCRRSCNFINACLSLVCQATIP